MSKRSRDVEDEDGESTQVRQWVENVWTCAVARWRATEAYTGLRASEKGFVTRHMKQLEREVFGHVVSPSARDTVVADVPPCPFVGTASPRSPAAAAAASPVAATSKAKAERHEGDEDGEGGAEERAHVAQQAVEKVVTALRAVLAQSCRPRDPETDPTGDAGVGGTPGTAPERHNILLGGLQRNATDVMEQLAHLKTHLPQLMEKVQRVTTSVSEAAQQEPESVVHSSLREL